MLGKSEVTSAIGFMCIGVVTWTSNLDAAGWLAHFSGYAPITFVTLGSALLGLTALLAFFYGRPLDALVFFGYAGLYSSLSLGMHAAITADADAWFLLLWAVVFFYIWLGSFKAGWARSLFLLLTWLALGSCVIPDLTAGPGFRVLRGYLGLLSALAAFYLSAAAAIDGGRGRTTLDAGAA